MAADWQAPADPQAERFSWGILHNEGSIRMPAAMAGCAQVKGPKEGPPIFGRAHFDNPHGEYWPVRHDLVIMTRPRPLWRPAANG